MRLAFLTCDRLAGAESSEEPLFAALRAAEKALTGLTPTPFIARVDLVASQGALHLMELKFIEPALYFATDARSPQRFLRALKRGFDSSRAI